MSLFPGHGSAGFLLLEGGVFQDITSPDAKELTGAAGWRVGKQEPQTPGAALNQSPRSWLIPSGRQKSGFSGDVNCMDR